MDYMGVLHAADDEDARTSDYDLSLERELGIGIDAARKGNEARFINDFRGVRKEGPNVRFDERVVQLGLGRREMRIGIWVCGGNGKGVRKGEELCVSYGKGFWASRDREQVEYTEESTATWEIKPSADAR
jgi:hypothetical protein